MITEVQWLGLCGLRESNLHIAWPYIMWAVRNRVESGRKEEFGVTAENAYQSVILHPRAFSWVDGLTGTPGEIYAKARRERLRLPAAEACAAWVLSTPMAQSLVSSRTFFFWAPQSMKPPGKLPPWNWGILRRFCPSSLIDPQHLTMAEEIKR